MSSSSSCAQGLLLLVFFSLATLDKLITINMCVGQVVLLATSLMGCGYFVLHAVFSLHFFHASDAESALLRSTSTFYVQQLPLASGTFESLTDNDYYK